ncbi:MAG: hypothetical protein U1F07_13405 [Rubrivivax sp.]
MKHRSTTETPAALSAPTRFALTGVALAAACLWGAQAWALGLGRINVQSALGEPLRAEIEVTAITPEEAASLKLRVASPETYKAQGVDYNAALGAAQVQLVRRPDGRSVLRVSSERAVLEPFVDVIVEASWSSGRFVRDYTMLFDPPTLRTAQAGAAAPVASPAPATPAPPRLLRRRSRRRPRRARSRRPGRRRHRRRRQRSPPRPPAGRNTRCARATRSAASPARSVGRASRSTRCWWHCSAPIRRPSWART